MQPQTASNSKAPLNRSAALLQDACATDSEAEDRQMYSDQESIPDRENHPPKSASAASAVRAVVGASQPASGKPMRFKVVRYEEYRQKWGTKGHASVWDEHLPGVPTSLPPKTEMELRTEENLLMYDPLPANPIPYPHALCHQQPQPSRRSHYERIPLAMLHYPKCDQARKPGAAGRLEVAIVRPDDEPSPARGRRRHKASLPCPVVPTASLDAAAFAAETPQMELAMSDASAVTAAAAPVALSTASAASSAAVPSATMAATTSESSKVSSLLATPPLSQSQPPSRQAPPPLAPLSQAGSTPPQQTPPPTNLNLESSSEDRSDDPPNPPNPPASPEQQRLSPTPDVAVLAVSSAAAATPAAASSAGSSDALALTPRVGRFTVVPALAPPADEASSASAVGGGSAGSAAPAAAPGTAAATAATPDLPLSQSSASDSTPTAPSIGEVSLNAHEVASMCQSYKPTMAHLFTPERVQAAFNWISHYRSEPPSSDLDEESTFQVTIDNVAQTVVYLSSQDGKKKKEQQPPPLPSVPASLPSAPSGGGGSSSGSGNMTRSSSVETRLEARINGVTDMLQGAILSTVKSEMEPLQQLVQQLRAAVQQRDAEIHLLNQTLTPLLSEETMTAILTRQARLSRPE